MLLSRLRLCVALRGRHAACLSSSTSAASRDARSSEPAKRVGGASEKLPPALELSLMVQALATFHAATGHFMVPFHFPIPHKNDTLATNARVSRIIERVVGDRADLDWPDAMRGINLGRVLHKFMTNKRYHERYPLIVEALRDIGFPVDVDWRQYLWKKLVIVPLQTYYSLEGHTLVPTDFVIPHGDTRWPRHTWGFRLGGRVHRLRQESDKLDPAELEDLLQLEFSFDVVETTWTDKILPALETFVGLHGHCNVKVSFVVPSEEPWPKKAWGLPLGSIVSAMRHKDGYAKQVARDSERLDELQFVWDHREASWNEIVLPSLETHFQVFGHTRVSRGFVVPSEAPWPTKAWGYALGVAVNHMRSAGAYAKELEASKERIDAIQFIWGLREFRWRECILPSLEVFADRYNHCRVPRDFVVPHEKPWPEEAWGLKLGNNVCDIRYNGAYSKFLLEDAHVLRAIGFLETLPSMPVRTKDFWESP